MHFDEAVLSLALRQLRSTNQRLERFFEEQFGPSDPARMEDFTMNPRLSVSRTIEVLEGIHENQSLRPHYEAMINQSLVLLVSYFASATRQLFRSAVVIGVVEGTSRALLGEQIKARVRDLRNPEMSIPRFVAEHLSSSSDLSFQDMKSIGRAFKRYFSVQRERDRVTNDIIIGQACRHAIVHNGALVDDQLLEQVRGAEPRKVHPRLEATLPIVIREEEVSQIGDSMTTYLNDLAESLDGVLAGNIA